MKDPVRVFVLIDRYLPILGGAQKNVHLLFSQLGTQGFQVTVLTRRVERHLATTETIEGIKIRRFAWSRLRLLSKFWCIAAFVWELIRCRHDYDIVVSVPCVPITDQLPAYLAALVTRKPYVIRTTGLDLECLLMSDSPTSNIEDYVPAGIWRRTFARASMTVTQSPLIERRAIELGIPNVITIPNPVDVLRFSPATVSEREAIRKKLGIPTDKTVVIYTSRYVHGKNHMVLIQAAKKLEQGRHAGRLHVMLLGATEQKQSSSNELELKSYVADHKMGTFINLLDDVPNVEEYLRAADIFVFPTMYPEGMSNAQLEAMACGLPVIASTLPQVLAVLPEDWPLTFEPSDVDALAALLIRALDQPEQFQALGVQLAEWTRARHQPARIVARYAELLRGTLDH